MKAIILAAGRGSRMLSLTKDKPKCLVELGGKPLLRWQLDALRAAGARDIAVVGGYRVEALQALAHLPGWNFTILHNPDWASTNMLASLMCGIGWASGQDCIISYSDIVFATKHIGALVNASHDIAITYDTLWHTLWSERFANPLDDAETFREEAGIVREIGNKPERPDVIQGQYMGLLRVTRKGWDTVQAQLDAMGEAAGTSDMTRFLWRMIEAGTHIGAVPVEGKWCEVDSTDDLILYQRKLAEKTSWPHDWR